MKLHLLLDNLNYLAIKSFPIIPIYIFCFTAITLIFIKLNKSDYFLSLLKIMNLEKNKFDSHSSLGSEKLNIFLQISYILLITLGIWLFVSSLGATFSFYVTLLFYLGFYVLQSIGFYAFSLLIGDKESSYFQHRLAHNELQVLILFPLLLVITYLPGSFFLLIPVIFGCFLFFSWVRSSIYLAKFISTFHIILYLCTLELMPILFLLKFVLTN